MSTTINKLMSSTKMVKVIAEIGCNHKGDFEIAKELINKAVLVCNCKCVKFQKRNNVELLSKEEYETPHPIIENAYGSTYGSHREYLEFTVKQHSELKNYCESLGVEYSTSVWDVTSAKEIIGLNPEMIKVPSATNLNFPVIKELADNYSGEIHLSLGMTTMDEEKEIVSFLEDHGALSRTVLYACTSGYPVKFDELFLLEVERLVETYRGRLLGVGFSGHHLGIAADIAAMTLGAKWVERHYTLDRTWKGTDHAASLEPDGLRRLVRDLTHVEQSLKYKPAGTLIQTELNTREKLKKVIYE